MAFFGLHSSLHRVALGCTRTPLQSVVAQKIASSTTRKFSHMPSLRPTASHSSTHSPFARSPLARTLPFRPSGADAAGRDEAIADLVPRTAISTHPALAGTQIRCGPRPTLSGATRLIQKRRHGFLSRIRTNKGRKLLARRRAKGRKRLGF